MALFDIKQVEKEAQAEINAELQTKAKNALVRKLRLLATSRQVVKNVEAEIEDLKASILDGSFVG